MKEEHDTCKNAGSEEPIITVWNNEKSSHLNEYNTANMQDIHRSLLN